MSAELRKELEKVAAQYGSRIYEYLGTDGIVYWSFTKHDRLTTAPMRLILQNKLGKHVINFVAELRRQSQEIMKDE
jgi:hypothetical protein